MYAGIESCIKGAFGDVLRGVDTGFYVDAPCAMNFLMDFWSGVGMLDVIYVVGNIGTYGSRFADGSKLAVDIGHYGYIRHTV